MSRFTVFLLIFGLISVCSTTRGLALRSDDWTRFHSPTGVYAVNMPKNYEVTTNRFRTSSGTETDREGRIINSENLISRYDQRPYKKAVKNYIIRLDQLIGPNLKNHDIDELIKKEMMTYILHYRKKDALFLKKEKIKRKAFNGAEMELVYNDPELGGPQGVRIRILFSDNTKLQQIFAGPEYLLQDKWTKDFFDSLYFLQGINKTPGNYQDEWNKQTSPLETFTAWTPPITEPFITAEPEVKFSDAAEVIKITINDPVRHTKLYSHIYGYRLDESLTYQSAEKIVFDRHVARYYKDPKGIQIKRLRDNRYSRIGTEFKHPPSKEEPYLDLVKVQAYFAKNYMVVQELIYSDLLRREPLIYHLGRLFEFHPERAHKVFLKKQAMTKHIENLQNKNKPDDTSQEKIVVPKAVMEDETQEDDAVQEIENQTDSESSDTSEDNAQ